MRVLYLLRLRSVRMGEPRAWDCDATVSCIYFASNLKVSSPCTYARIPSRRGHKIYYWSSVSSIRLTYFITHKSNSARWICVFRRVLVCVSWYTGLIVGEHDRQIWEPIGCIFWKHCQSTCFSKFMFNSSAKFQCLSTPVPFQTVIWWVWQCEVG